MGAEQQQEVKSLPRNRKCGNCRYFEPAPLWRKGWCRNPQLYPPHANHLVDSATIDCEGGFRSRIYWEPIPQTQVNQSAAPNTDNTVQTPLVNRVRPNNNQTDQPTISMQTPPPPTQSRSGSFGPKFNNNLNNNEEQPRPNRQPKPQPRYYQSEDYEQEVVEAQYKPVNDDEYYADEAEPIVYEAEPVQQQEPENRSYRRTEQPREARPPRPRREAAPRRAEPVQREQPNGQPNGLAQDWREAMRRSFPFTENWPLERVNLQKIWPWAVVIVLALIVFIIVGSNRSTNNGTTNGVNTTPAAITASVTSGTTPLVTSGPSSNGNGNTSSNTGTGTGGTKSGTGTGTNTKPGTTTGTSNATTTTVATNPIAGKTATLTDGVNLRKDPSTTSAKVDVLKKGTQVTLLDGPTTADGHDWYEVKSSSEIGWVVKDYVQIQS